MFDVGFWEILFILVLALVIIGPERLPGAARQVGFFVGKARRYIEGVRSEVEAELDVGEFKRILHNQEVQINELQQQIKTGVDTVSTNINAVSTDIKKDMPSSDFLNETLSDASREEQDPETETEDSVSDESVQTNQDKP